MKRRGIIEALALAGLLVLSSAGVATAGGAATSSAAASVLAVSSTVSTSSTAGLRAEKRTTLAQNFTEVLAQGRRYFVTGIVEYRRLAITDADPSNDQALTYALRAGYSLAKGLTAWGQVAMTQRFWAEPDESNLFLRDVQLGLDYLHQVPLDAVGLEGKKLFFTHRAAFFLPSSRRSQAQDLQVAPELLNRVRLNPVGNLHVGVDAVFQYRFHRYAEAAGLEGGLLNRYALSGLAVAEYVVLESETLGSLILGVDLSSSWVRRYPSRNAAPSVGSDRAPWFQDWGWDLYAFFLPRPFFALLVNLGQSSPVLRNGVRNLSFFHRDETEVSLTAIFRY